MSLMIKMVVSVMTHKGPRLSGASYDLCCRGGVEHEEVCANVSSSALPPAFTWGVFYESGCCDLVMEGDDRRLVFFNIGANDGGSVGKFLNPHDHPRSVISAIVIHEVLAGASRGGSVTCRRLQGWLQRFPPSKTTMHAIEPNPIHRGALEGLPEMYPNHTVVVLPAAAGVAGEKETL
ncbi:hypothetical protein FOZ62_003953 [Perkinsus olseni]|uniref:Uncharacterized protein n=1 Tax=Perkinsus olseni TaxID=32597 RepID=A0A7J6QAX6_PEROL|nr:hypothetical protein FOZ62_003953 [Perkinsus olseni]